VYACLSGSEHCFEFCEYFRPFLTQSIDAVNSYACLDVAWSVCVCGINFGHTDEPCKTREPMKMRFGGLSCAPNEACIRCCPDHPRGGGNLGGSRLYFLARCRLGTIFLPAAVGFAFKSGDRQI